MGRAGLAVVLLACLVTAAGVRFSLATYAGVTSVGGNTMTAAASFCTGAGSQTLTAASDSYVDQANPTTNYGTATTLGVEAATGKNQRTLVQFSLPAVPAHCSLTAATLRLDTTTSRAGRTYQALQIASSWTEVGVTWNTQPAATGAVATAPTVAVGQWIQWTVTGQVQAMYAGSNYGFLVKDASESTATSYTNRYSSRTGANPPQLVLTWG